LGLLLPEGKEKGTSFLARKNVQKVKWYKRIKVREKGNNAIGTKKVLRWKSYLTSYTNEGNYNDNYNPTAMQKIYKLSLSMQYFKEILWRACSLFYFGSLKKK